MKRGDHILRQAVARLGPVERKQGHLTAILAQQHRGAVVLLPLKVFGANLLHVSLMLRPMIAD